jgi:imidazolonepropionase-like amidohydrolase
MGDNPRKSAQFLFLAAVSFLGTSPTQAASVVVFRDVLVFDGTSGLAPTTVVVRDGVITQVGPSAVVPEGAQVVDGTGKTLLPGLIDGHTHTFTTPQLRQAAVFGVTTELDMFTSHEFAARMRAEQAAAAGARDRADLFSAGTLATVAGGHGTEYPLKIPTIDAPAEAQTFVDARIAEGSDYIKIVYDDGHVYGLNLPTLRRETLAALVRAAHARNKLAVVHVMARENARAALAEGADGLVHVWVDAPADDDLVRLAVEQKAFVIPTLTVLERGGQAIADDPALASWLSPDDLRTLKMALPFGMPAGRDPAGVVRKLFAAGVRIVAGTDAPNPGTVHGATLHRELERLVAAGLTPAQALAAATSVPAAVFGLSDRGRIAPGLRADLVLVNGDPLSDIKATRAIAGVWKKGERLDRDAYRAELWKQIAGATPGDKMGLVSDFENDTVETAFGSGWMVSTDRFVGGKSQATFTVVPGGARGSKGSLRIAGTIDDKPQSRWAGVLFSPGPAPMAPANLSANRAVSFWAKGDGKTFSVMLFFQARGFTPSVQSFVATADWQQHRYLLKDFDGCDGNGLMGLFFGGGAEAGPFELQIDDVRFDLEVIRDDS